MVQLTEVGKNTCNLSGVQCQRFKDHHELHLHLHEHSEHRSDLSLPDRVWVFCMRESARYSVWPMCNPSSARKITGPIILPCV